MRRHTWYPPWALAAVVIAAVVAACTDRGGPMAPEPPDGTPTGPGGPAVTLQVVECAGSVSARTVTCAPPAAGAGQAAGDIVVGGQNVYVTLAGTNVAYNGGTGQFTFEMTLQSLIEQPMGTLDGTNPDPGGIRVFFHSGPVVTGGLGTASVVPDGFGTFTAAGQPYYAYTGVLVQNQTSSPRTWTLIVSPTVETFTFTLYVSAPVQHPDGYITLDGHLPGAALAPLHPDDVHTLTAVIKSAVGNVLPGTVTFGTTDPDCATVNPTTGAVTGVQAGTCSITATDGTRSGGVTMNVTGAVRVWEGSLSSDWSAGGNWVGGRVPVAVDSVLVPASAAAFPALVASTTVAGVEVEDGATLSLGAFDLTLSRDLATGPSGGSGVLAAGGTLVLAGTGTVVGRVPSLRVTGAYALAGHLRVVAPETVDAGTLDSPNHEMTIEAQ